MVLPIVHLVPYDETFNFLDHRFVCVIYLFYLCK